MKKLDREKQKLIVFLADLGEHAAREVCFGAAEYAANRFNLTFEPWPISSKGGTHPLLADFQSVQGLLLTERAARLVFKGNKIKMPHVFILTSKDELRPSVGLSESQFGRMAAEHLIERGYPNLISLCVDSLEWSRQRADGFDAVCRERKIKPRRYEVRIEDLPAYWTSKIARRREKLCLILKELPKPCGLFAANDVMAFFAVETARSCGFAIPGDVAVIGVDDDPIPNAAAGLSISSIRPPFREIGRQAAAMLECEMARRQGLKHLSLPPVKTVVRASTDEFSIADPLMQRAQRYIEEHRREGIRVIDLTREMQTTAVTLGNYFRRYLQTTPASYILSRRIEYAKELLREGKLNVQEVSETCRFHSCSYFCKIFRKMTGLTPNQVRKQIRRPIPKLNG